MSLTGAFRLLTVAVWLTGTSLLIWLTRTVLRMLIDVEASEPRNFLVVGTGPRGLALGRELATAADIRLVGYVDAGPPVAGSSVELGAQYLGEVRDLDRILLDHAVDQVYVTLPLRSRYEDFEAALQACERTGVSASWLADQFASTPGTHRRRISGNGGVISSSPEPDFRLLIVKRMMDLAGAGAGLVATAPLLALAAVIIKLSDGGPVLYVQARHGQYRRPFKMYKLRTMVDGAESLQETLEDRNEASGPVFKIREDPRITRVGRFLRRTSIDELPQLFNVLRGDMSLVGPRPLPLRDVARFTEAALVRRFSVRPGLTGLWQVSGRSDVPFDRWIELDLEYVDRWSLALDGQIILKTLPAVLSGTGAT
jgi:exopolysaccharide biosynthesis polyprenyl glycosylphosphotransferase